MHPTFKINNNIKNKKMKRKEKMLKEGKLICQKQRQKLLKICINNEAFECVNMVLKVLQAHNNAIVRQDKSLPKLKVTAPFL